MVTQGGGLLFIVKMTSDKNLDLGLFTPRCDAAILHSLYLLWPGRGELEGGSNWLEHNIMVSDSS